MMQRVDNFSKKRYTLLDILRGVAIIAMVIYHTLWDLVYMFGVNIPWFRTDAGFIFQQCICWSFILLSGFCWSLGRHRLRRALIVLACALVITVVTALVMPENIILHGVLSLLGTAMLVTIPCDKLLSKVHPVAGFAVCAVLFVLTRNICDGSLGFGDTVILHLPDFLYANSATAFFGFPHNEFFSSDYFPILPWLFLFWIGYFLYRVFQKKGLLPYLAAVSFRPLEFIGRHSLEIYVAHQPIIFGVLFIIFKII